MWTRAAHACGCGIAVKACLPPHGSLLLEPKVGTSLGVPGRRPAVCARPPSSTLEASLFLFIYLAVFIVFERQRAKHRPCVHWFTPQMPATARLRISHCPQPLSILLPPSLLIPVSFTDQGGTVGPGFSCVSCAPQRGQSRRAAPGSEQNTELRCVRKPGSVWNTGRQGSAGSEPKPPGVSSIGNTGPSRVKQGPSPGQSAHLHSFFPSYSCF